jgi:hypothetical protein
MALLPRLRHYPDFPAMRVLAETTPLAALSPLTVSDVLERVLSLEPGLIARLDRGANLLQPGCLPDAQLLRGLARQFPKSSFAGTDRSVKNVAAIRRQVAADALQNVWLMPAELDGRAWGPIFDIVLLPDAAAAGTDEAGVLASAAAQLKSDGVLVMHTRGVEELRHTRIPGMLRAAGFNYVRSAALPAESDAFCFIARK